MIPVLFALLAGSANLLGGLVVVAGARRLTRFLDVLVAFGAGFMLAVAFVEMLPSALEVTHGLTVLLAGYLAVHLTQHALTPHFHFGEETHPDAMVSPQVGVWALVGLLPHAFFDGVAIAAGFLHDPALGLLIFGAVFLHKVPTGLSLGSIMLASGNSARRALLAVTAIALATVLGAAVTPAFGLLAHYGLALAAGVTIYVAASNLIPEAQKQRRWQVPVGLVVGVVAFYLARLLLH
jgi:zinc and cadmium transporter